jgi:hypothetical protein
MKTPSGYLVIYSFEELAKHPWGGWQYKRTRAAADKFAAMLRKKLLYVVVVVKASELMEKE